jgi:hypothetical protein
VKIFDTAGADGGIPVEEFVGSFAEGKQPVGPGDLGIYFHDVRSDDHMPGTLVAGHEGMALAAVIAKAVIQTGTQSEHGMFFDNFTSKIGRIAESSPATIGREMDTLCRSFDRVANAVGADVSSDQLRTVLGQRFRKVGGDINDRNMKKLADYFDPEGKVEVIREKPLNGLPF